MDGVKFGVRIVERSLDVRAGSPLLTLNNTYAEALTPLSALELQRLLDQAFVALRVGEADAFLIALDQGADYDSPNFVWFRARVARFVYVDRVAVAAHARGCGFGRALYQTLIAHARATGHERIVSEVNADPPNPDSDAFHSAMGFTVVGEATLSNGKSVRYYARALDGAGGPARYVYAAGAPSP
jgi:hypothetical protein